eukprot:COSAG06_NODE_1511_length_9233_cov_3.730896_5_plen_76_part_00
MTEKPAAKVAKYRYGSNAPDASANPIGKSSSKTKGGATAAAAAAAAAAANGGVDPNDPSYIQAIKDAQTYLSSMS